MIELKVVTPRAFVGSLGTFQIDFSLALDGFTDGPTPLIMWMSLTGLGELLRGEKRYEVEREMSWGASNKSWR